MGKALQHLSRLNADRRFRIAFSIVLAVFMVGLMALSDRTDIFDDDWTISVALSGRYPDSGLSLFINALISHVTLALNEVLPFVNWFLFIEYGVSALAFAVLIYVALTHLHPAVGVLFIAGAEYFLIPFCTYYSNFTFVAAACTLAGFSLLLANAASERGSGKRIVLGVCLCALGYAFRVNAFLLTLPFFAIALVCILVRRSRERRAQDTDDAPCRTSRSRWLSAAVAPFALVALMCAALFAYDTFAWLQPGWSEWREWNDCRSQISDFIMPPYADVEEELQAAGITEDAYYLATHWATGDTDYFDLERMEVLASVSRSQSLSATIKGALGYPASLLAGNRMFIFFAVMTLLMFALSEKRRWLPLALIVLVALAACSFFFGLGRLLARVENPIYLYALASMLFVMGPAPAGSITQRFSGVARRAAAGVAVGAFALVTVYLVVTVGATTSPEQAWKMVHQQDFQPHDPLIDGAMEGDQTYVWSTMDYVVLEYSYEHRYLPTTRFLEKNVQIGGWSTDSPYLRARNEAIGLPNVVKGLVERDDVYLVSSDPFFTERLLGFIRHEYFPNARVSVVDALRDSQGDSYDVYAFSAS